MTYGYLTPSTWLENVLGGRRAGTGSLVFDAERRRKAAADRTPSAPPQDIHRIG